MDNRNLKQWFCKNQKLTWAINMSRQKSFSKFRPINPVRLSIFALQSIDDSTTLQDETCRRGNLIHQMARSSLEFRSIIAKCLAAAENRKWRGFGGRESDVVGSKSLFFQSVNAPSQPPVNAVALARPPLHKTTSSFIGERPANFWEGSRVVVLAGGLVRGGHFFPALSRPTTPDEEDDLGSFRTLSFEFADRTGRYT